MGEFSARDPATAAFWDERYRAGFTPWDARAVPAALTRFVESARPGRRVLVPGCGSAYEAGYLDALGFAVTAIDIAPEALARARAVLGDATADRVLVQADFFALEREIDWIYERALLCALPYRLWPEYGAAVRRLLHPGGLLAGFFYIHNAAEEPRRGPPFPAHRTEIEALFAPGFHGEADEDVPEGESIPVFARHERWMVWRRRDDAPAASIHR
ncbi:MAG: methyltransferase domain-containing protein [Burkholderiaceae bacterium]